MFVPSLTGVEAEAFCLMDWLTQITEFGIGKVYIISFSDSVYRIRGEEAVA